MKPFQKVSKLVSLLTIIISVLVIIISILYRLGADSTGFNPSNAIGVALHVMFYPRALVGIGVPFNVFILIIASIGYFMKKRYVTDPVATTEESKSLKSAYIWFVISFAVFYLSQIILYK